MDEAEGRAKWEQHVAAAQAEGKPLAQYAREHGIGAWGLYKAQRRMRKRGGVALRPDMAASDPAAGRFAKVRIAPLAPMPLRAQLPNGVRIELAADDSLVDVLRILAQLPCSA